MASSRKTEKYGLSQFDTIDDPSWYTDYNQDMQILDGNAMSKTEYDPLGAISEAGGIKPAIDAASAACAAALKTHVDDKANPHGVTAAQAGAYSKAEADGLLSGKAAAADLAAHTGDTANPHGVTATQAGTYTKAEIDTLLARKASENGDNVWRTVPLINGFTNYYANLPLSYKKQNGVVTVYGVIALPPTMKSTVFTKLPVGYGWCCTGGLTYQRIHYVNYDRENEIAAYIYQAHYDLGLGFISTPSASKAYIICVEFSANM